MKPQLFRTLLVVALIVFAPRAQSESLTECLTTMPSGQIFGKPFPSSDRWVWNESIAGRDAAAGWHLARDGPEHHYRDKLFWWSYGFKPGGESNI